MTTTLKRRRKKLATNPNVNLGRAQGQAQSRQGHQGRRPAAQGQVQGRAGAAGPPRLLRSRRKVSITITWPCVLTPSCAVLLRNLWIDDLGLKML
jgi:hypothetical protein